MYPLRILFCFLLLTICCSVLSAQIGGVNAAKINAITPAPITKGTAEFEPNYSFTRFNQAWDDKGNLRSIYSNTDSVEIQTQMSFRWAYGLSDKIEIGGFLAEDFSNWSIKHNTFIKEKLALGFQGGVNLPFGNIVRNNSNKQPDQISTYIIGIGGTYEFSEILSLDFNVQLQDYFSSHSDLPSNDLFFFTDAGYYINDVVMIMGSISYQTSKFSDFRQNKFSFYPGFALEMIDNYFIVVNGMFDLSGKNTEKTSGVALSLTMTL